MFLNNKKIRHTYKNKYLKYKGKYFNLKNKQVGGAAPERIFNIYTTGIGYWSPYDESDNNLIMHWVNGIFDNILHQIPIEYTHIHIHHYDLLLVNHQQSSNPFDEEAVIKYHELTNQLTISDENNERVVSSEFKIEPFNDELLTTQGTDFSRDCIIIDFAHLYNHHETKLGLVFSSSMYKNQKDWTKELKRLPILRFGFPNDPVPKMVGRNCKLFIVNPDGTVITYVDILRIMRIKIISSEPLDTIRNVFLEGGKNVNKMVEKIVKKISGKQYFEAHAIYDKIEHSEVNVCIIFDMLFERIPMNHILFKLTEEQLKNTFIIYKGILPLGTTLSNVLSKIQDVFSMEFNIYLI